MPIIERVRTTRRVRETRILRERGYLPAPETRDFQEIVTEVRILGFVLRTIVEDREQIPPHAAISLGAFGDTGGWRSRFAGFIAQCRAKGVPPARPVTRRVLLSPWR